MRLRVLFVDGMPRPIAVLDELPEMSMMEVDIIKQRTRASLPDYDVLVISDVDLPQVSE